MKVSVTAALVVATAGAATAADHIGKPELQARLDTLVTAAGGQPAPAVAAVAEVRRGGTVWRLASGTTVLDGSRPAPVDARFRIGSVTKTFTATMVLQLVGEGRLSLSDRLRDLLPELAVPGDATITLEDLLQHTTGIPNYVADVVDADGLPKDRFHTYAPADLVRLAVAHLDGPAAGGSPYHYSDTNYIMLGMVVEKVTGQSYRTELQRRILGPLDLRHTTEPGAFPFLTGPHAHGYVPATRDGGVVEVDATTVNPTVFGAAGDIVSTAADLDSFYHALFGGRLLHPAQLAAMTTPRGPDGYGLGVESLTLSCGRVYGHSGSVPGYGTASFDTLDGSRQVTLSVALRTNPPFEVVANILDGALCG